MKIETKQNKQSGFTLVELAIVMIIIGLLIGGILKGQELIANSQVTATIAQVKGIDAAMSTFRDKYGALPGDMDPANRLANCTAAPCSTAGDEDGRVDGANAIAGRGPAIGNESVVAFSHMAASDLLSGVETNGGTLVFGSALPEAKVGGGFTGIENSNAGALQGTNGGGQRGHYLIINGSPTGNVANGTGAMAPVRAAQIDRKLDDGLANTGTVIGNVGSAAAPCAAGNNDADGYLEDDGNGVCALFVRIQG